MRPSAILAVFQFEFRRTAAISRLGSGLLLGLFPVALVATIQYLHGPLHFAIPGLIAMFALIPGLTCVLTLLLWATPILHAEMEGRTWPYLAVAPCGKSSILLGKYLAAVVWAAVVAWLSLTLSILVIAVSQNPKTGLDLREIDQLASLRTMQNESQLDQTQQQQLSSLLGEKSMVERRRREEARFEAAFGPRLQLLRAWSVLAALVALSAVTYGALFAFFGVILLKRAMTMAVAYTFLFEVVVSMLPAVVHRLTVQYHLRCLLVKWMSWTEWPRSLAREAEMLFGDEPVWQHILMPLGLATVMLIVACLVLKRRQLVLADEA